MIEKSILGVDISKRYFDICLIQNGKEKYRKFDNNIGGFDKLSEFLKSEHVGDLHVCMEATGRLYESLALYLVEIGYCVSVINPKCIKGFAQSELLRSKTDKKDAGVIARFCKAHSPRDWHPHPPEIRELQETMRYIDSLKTHIHQEERRLESGITSETVRSAIEEHVRFLKAQLVELKLAMKKHVKRHARLQKHFELLTSIIGVGEVAALSYLAEIGYSDQVKQTRHIESFFGLAPKQHQSGSSVRTKDHISKIGNSRMRQILYMPSLAAKGTNPVLRAFAERLAAAGKPPKVVICAVMRKMLRIMYAVTSSETPFDPSYRPGPLEGMTFAEDC